MGVYLRNSTGFERMLGFSVCGVCVIWVLRFLKSLFLRIVFGGEGGYFLGVILVFKFFRGVWGVYFFRNGFLVGVFRGFFLLLVVFKVGVILNWFFF